MAANGHAENGYIMNGDSRNGDVMNGGSKNGGPNDERASEFLRHIFELMLTEGVEKTGREDSKVVDFLHPKALRQRIELDLKEEGDSHDELLELCRKTIQYSVRTGHPHFFNQLYQGQDLYGLAGAWITDLLNTSQYTYEVAPVFTLMEQVMLQKMRDVIGYTKGDGIFCPGGSISNMYGLNLSRYNKFPQVKTQGLHGLPQMCVFTSQDSHYSVLKGAAFLGLGVNNVIKVECDDSGKMIPDALDAAIENAKTKDIHPLMVNATGGTTVAGAYDPVEDIARVCEKHGVWLHVDMCWGGGAILSTKHKHLLKGIDRADSVAWNPHKMMGAPLQCCAFLTKHEGLLQQCHSASATYLFQQDKCYDVSYDTGDKSIQCGRKVDVFKLWLMWKAYGEHGLESHIDHMFDCARYFTERVGSTPGFRLVYKQPECTNVCFWYIPPSLRGQEETDEWWQQVGKVAPLIKERMMMKGSMLIGYQPHGSKVNFFRMVVANHATEKQHMDFCLEEIDRLGKDM